MPRFDICYMLHLLLIYLCIQCNRMSPFSQDRKGVRKSLDQYYYIRRNQTVADSYDSYYRLLKGTLLFSSSNREFAANSQVFVLHKVVSTMEYDVRANVTCERRQIFGNTNEYTTLTFLNMYIQYSNYVQLPNAI